MSWPNWTGQPISQANVPAVANPAVLPGVQYNPEQWAQLQQQNWQQWAQWQQQYQQWQQQYGAEYQKSINALATTNLPNVAVPPPLPLIDNKPPPPPDDQMPSFNTNKNASVGYSTMPPKVPQTNQFRDVQEPVQGPSNRQNWQQNKRPYNRGNDYENSKKQMIEKPNWNANLNQNQGGWTGGAPIANNSPKPNIEELSEAEKKFDKEFAAWEEQFNKWKQQNATHPDKEQYREYEKKWESWRNSLLERREQMRRKRLNLLATTTNTNANIKPNCNFNEPPPLTTQPQPLITRNSGLLPTPSATMPVSFNKPPPNLNNEPLSFKPPTTFPGEDVNNDFLKPTPASDGIPGLDLAESKDEKENEEDGQDNNKNVESTGNSTSVPDFDVISKNINTILGDQKLLNMLSMVSQNQSVTPSNNCTDTQSRISEQSIPNEGNHSNIQSYNEHSNNSFDERSNQGEMFNTCESVNNFDDQTRSSFTLGPNDHDYRQENFNRSQNRFNTKNNRNESHFNDNMPLNRNNFGRNEMPFSGINNSASHNNRFESNFTNQNQYGNVSNTERRTSFSEFRNDNNYQRNYESENRTNFKNNDFNRGNANKPQFNETNYDDQWNSNDYEKYNSYNDYQTPPDYEENLKNPKEEEIKEEEILFEPSNVIDYNHKPAKPADPEVLIEPIHMFDYRHKSLNRIPIPQRPKWLSDTVKNIREFDPLASRMYDRRLDSWHDIERRGGPNFRDNRWISRTAPRDKPFEDRRLYNRQHNLRSEYKMNEFDNKIKKPTYSSIQNNADQEKKNEFEELSDDEMDWNNDSDANDQDITKNHDNIICNISTNKIATANTSTVSIEELVMPPGRYKRPSRFVIILRGPPGSGKTHLAKLIKDKEVEFGGSAPRILSLDDYFMVEQEKETVEDGKIVKVKEMVYEYEAEMEQSYRSSLIKSFKKTITDGYFSFIIVDNINDKLKYFGEMWSFAKHNGFQVYICQLELDKDVCTKRNVHNRTEKEIENCISGWEQTPSHHTIVDPTTFLQSCSIPDVVMEEGNTPVEDANDEEVTEDQVRSKWDNFDCSVNNLAKLDGVSKPLRPSHQSMEQYLQLDDEWESKPTKPGQKRVRWADIEEQKQQAKMRAIGFVVGQTNWNRMMDPTYGESALTQTKYIDKIKRN